MGKALRLALLGLIVTGCAKPDPETSRFDPGAVAVLIPSGESTMDPDGKRTGPPSDDVYIEVRRGDGIAEGLDFRMVPGGTRVTVISDSEKAEKHLAQFRKVRIRVSEGRFTDLTGAVTRSNLRPAPR